MWSHKLVAELCWRESLQKGQERTEALGRTEQRCYGEAKGGADGVSQGAKPGAVSFGWLSEVLVKYLLIT